MGNAGIFFSTFSSANIGLPALTRPITGISSIVLAHKEIPLEVPDNISIKPFFFKAFR